MQINDKFKKKYVYHISKRLFLCEVKIGYNVCIILPTALNIVTLRRQSPVIALTCVYSLYPTGFEQAFSTTCDCSSYTSCRVCFTGGRWEVPCSKESKPQ